jgi:hypothetical protein
MPRISRIANIATLVVGAAAVATACQTLLMPQVQAWEAEVVAAFMGGLPR